MALAETSGDWSSAPEINRSMRDADRTFFPNRDFSKFSEYDIGLEKARTNTAGCLNAGPFRPPYHLVPEAYLEGARQSGRAWAALHRKYASK